MPNNEQTPSGLAHGAQQLPSVIVGSYNVELRDQEGFIGDRASFSITGAGNSLAIDPELIYVSAPEPGAIDELEARPVLMRELARLNNIIFAPPSADEGILFSLPF